MNYFQSVVDLQIYKISENETILVFLFSDFLVLITTTCGGLGV